MAFGSRATIAYRTPDGPSLPKNHIGASYFRSIHHQQYNSTQTTRSIYDMHATIWACQMNVVEIPVVLPPLF